jgi:hypothetical protein
VMRNNVFEFGDILWLQLIGTAMGTSVACMYATIYFSYHEETGILVPTTLQGEGKLLLYKRFIDDAIIIFTAVRRHFCHQLFLDKMNDFGEQGKRLVWEATKPGKSVDFMDLTITLQPDGRITTATYQKPMNLYLYLPPTSAHSPALQQSIIYSALKRMRIQNSSSEDFIRFTALFYKRLRARGHTDEILSRQFAAAAKMLDKQPLSCQPTCDNRQQGNRLFLHVQFHPSTPARAMLRTAFNNTCAEAIRRTPNESGYALGDTRLTIAYSRCTCIRDIVSRSRLQQSNANDVLVSHRIARAHAAQSAQCEQRDGV